MISRLCFTTIRYLPRPLLYHHDFLIHIPVVPHRSVAFGNLLPFRSRIHLSSRDHHRELTAYIGCMFLQLFRWTSGSLGKAIAACLVDLSSGFG